MKRILLLFLSLIIFAPLTFAYTYTATDPSGKVLVDRKCDANGSYFNCTDNLTGQNFSEPRHTREVQDIYINGQYKRVIKEQYGDKVYIKY